MIRHAAIFQLIHKAGSTQEANFLADLAKLSAIPGVGAIEISREISPKNAFNFAVSMIFADAAAYAAYNIHPAHVAFVQTRWIPEVASFLEHDTTPL